MTVENSSPFETAPSTQFVYVEGSLVKVIVKARAMSPIRARIRDILVRLSAFIVGCVVIYKFALLPEFTWYYLAFWLLVVAMSFPISHFIYAKLLETEKTIVFTRAYIEFLSPGVISRARKVERDQPHRFELREHDWADRERDRHDYLKRRAQSRGRIRNLKPYFGQSFHIVLKRRTERLDVMTVFGKKTAELIHSRLKDCDEIMGCGSAPKLGTAINPGSDWSNQPGNLPE